MKNITEWSSNNVVEWMAALQLHRYAGVFKSKDIRGYDLIHLDRDNLISMGIKDEFHQKAILSSIDDLCDRIADINIDKSEGYCTSSAHRLREHSFSSLERCDKCHKYLRGLQHQGFLCQDCGMVVHRACSATGGLPTCLTAGINLKTRQARTVFGLPLCSQFNASEAEAPPLLVRCTQELEAQARSVVTLDLYKVYRTSVSSDVLAELKEKFSDDMSPVDLSKYEPFVIASTIKKFLRELPDPVIPVQWYDRFMEASRIRDDEQCAMCLNHLVQELPVHHRSTLRFMLAHFCRLCQLQYARGSKEPPTILMQVLCHLFLRPPWERFIQVVYNTESHIRIIELLFLFGDWGESLPEFASAPMLPPRKPSRTAVSAQQSSTLSDFADPPMSLVDVDWYWGNITREEANERLRDKSDGTFLVRDASNKSGEYTLTLRKGGANKLIKIFCRGGKYGFTEPYKFPSVIELVNFYRNVSLGQYNPTLDTKLLYPVSRFSQEDEILASAADVEKVTHQLVELHTDYLQNTKRFEDFRNNLLVTSQDIQYKKDALEACCMALEMLHDQVKLHEVFKVQAQPHEVKLLKHNFELLKDRIALFEENKKQLEDDVKKAVLHNRTLDREMNALKPPIMELQRQKEYHQKWLLQHGIKQARLNQLLRVQHQQEMETDTENLPHQKCATWLLPHCTRNQAERLLAQRKDGTFLVRHSRTGQYALSIVCNGTVSHCIINKTDRGYGFAEPFDIYASLKELVLHYAQNSLEEHNDSLTITLAYPVLEDPTGK